ncbi:MAG: hypothetical protein COU63_04325 [Candidatus Pacebacteria bacterium CG10_big_fil_rev_8_21_14_0_10_36_11]|nr:phospholipid carrier-dependent glycosyltransferase [Candidatus Pacearchaeota archaeon]OIP74119.1 MAG: hypothetical protein AUK08_02600 [Candidatus Pacebacteria bacterium CG2_30_36_39]PIR64487.1 MAG: hypothetical protein COU63_04325 [Candidatus Pacebacteria bacterium CG10_big_fil_rev_8_21_14_0_10_36_11]PJC42578.1 MAG: hypothetical protein CO040_03735 [Candidatus Pacebacteria bacterium CG_4_9_14_0_2_um_filter_36_8]
MKRLFEIPYSFSLLAILFFSLLVRFFQLGQPADYVFDERYHLPAVRLIAENDPRAFEWWHPPIYGVSNHDWLHPPLAKYIQATVYKLGHGSVESWRLGSVIFGLGGIVLTYVLGSLVFNNRLVGILSALILSLDGLWLVQSRVGMNDVFVTVWLLLAAIVYVKLKKKTNSSLLLLVGIFLGIGIATKWTAMFWLVGILSYELVNVWRKKTWRLIPWQVFCLLAVPIFIYLLSYLPMFIQGKDFSYFLELHKNIWWYQTHRESLHLFQSIPAQWINNTGVVWYWHGSNYENIYAFNNPLLVVLENIALLVTIYAIARKNVNHQYLSLLLFFYAMSFVLWVFSPRILFYYHYTPALPFLAIILGYWLKKIYFSNVEVKKSLLFLFTIVCLVFVFWLYYPAWIGFPVSKDLQDTVYYFLPGQI